MSSTHPQIPSGTGIGQPVRRKEDQRLVTGAGRFSDDYNLPAVRGSFEAYFAGRSDALTPLPWGQVVVVKVSG